MPRKNWAWKFASLFFFALKLPAVRRFVSREYTDYLATRTPPRPTGYSLTGGHESRDESSIVDYVSGPSPRAHTFSARHLPPVPSAAAGPVPPRAAPGD